MAARSSTAPIERAQQYLFMALYAYAVFGWELVVTLLGDPLWAQADTAVRPLLHWGVTAVGWAAGAAVILHAIRRPDRGLPGAFSGALAGRVGLRTVGVVLAVVLAIGIRALVLHEWKLVGEYARLSDAQGDATPAAFALLMLYYLCETAVIVLVIALGQRAGELRFGRPAVPWGGLLLACTWGATHILLQGPATGVYAMLAAVLYGCIYSLGRRGFWATGAFVAVAFIV